MTKVWMHATGVPHRMVAAGWQTPFYWLAADPHETTEGQLVIAFALEGAIAPDDLPEWRPRCASMRRMHACWPREATIGWATPGHVAAGWCARPAGATPRRRPFLPGPIERVLMAGSDIAPEFSGWIAGAIASGRQAAADARTMLAEP